MKSEKVKNSAHSRVRNFLEAPPGFGPGIRVLQTRALPLGHGAVFRMPYYYSKEEELCQGVFEKRQKFLKEKKEGDTKKRRFVLFYRQRVILSGRA